MSLLLKLLSDLIDQKLKQVLILSPRMRKLSRAVITGFLLFGAVSLWLIGSIIVIQIDSEDLLNSRRFANHEKSLRKRVDTYCRILDKRDLAKISTQNDGGRGTESLEVLERARREKLIRDNLIYIPELDQMWCLVPKAASTSWSKAIVDRLNSDHLRMFVDPKANISLQVLLRQNYGNISKKTYIGALGNTEIKKVLLVRHPFSRIISAYQDKLLNRKARPDGMYFFQRYGVGMNRQFRANRKLNKKKEPTFDEFIQYLINTDTMEYDEHWKPISLLCGLCHVRYDHIILVDDLKDSADFHLQTLGFPQGYRFPYENSQSTKSTFRDHFRNISSSKKIKLLKKYQDDFRLFGYSFLQHYIS